MMATYFLSRTLVPTMMHYLLGSEIELYQDEGDAEAGRRDATGSGAWHSKFDRQFDRMARPLQARAGVVPRQSRPDPRHLWRCSSLLSLPLLFFIGQRLLPLRRLRPDAPARLPAAGHAPRRFRAVLRRDREGDPPASFPPDEIELILDNIGLPNGGINLAFSDCAVISNSDGDILISLKPGKRNTAALHARAARRPAREVSRRRRSSSRRPTSPTRS